MRARELFKCAKLRFSISLFWALYYNNDFDKATTALCTVVRQILSDQLNSSKYLDGLDGRISE